MNRPIRNEVVKVLSKLLADDCDVPSHGKVLHVRYVRGIAKGCINIQATTLETAVEIKGKDLKMDMKRLFYHF